MQITGLHSDKTIALRVSSREPVRPAVFSAMPPAYASSALPNASRSAPFGVVRQGGSTSDHQDAFGTACTDLGVKLIEVCWGSGAATSFRYVSSLQPNGSLQGSLADLFANSNDKLTPSWQLARTMADFAPRAVPDCFDAVEIFCAGATMLVDANRRPKGWRMVSFVVSAAAKITSWIAKWTNRTSLVAATNAIMILCKAGDAYFLLHDLASDRSNSGIISANLVAGTSLRPA